MLSDAATALNSILSNVVALQHANGAGRAFELYIMTGIADELRKRGASVHLQRSDGTIIGPHDPNRAFIQRGGAPTGIFGASAGPSNASSIVFQIAGCPIEWEIWNGVQFMGRSHGTHEVDIAVVPRAVGQTLRGLASGGTPCGRPAVSIECKDVGSGKNPAVASPDDVRAFIARMYDLTMLNWHDGKIAGFPTPLTKIFPGVFPGSGAYYSFKNANDETLNVIAHRTGFASGASAMTGYYSVRARPGIKHKSTEYTDLITEICDWIEIELC